MARKCSKTYVNLTTLELQCVAVAQFPSWDIQNTRNKSKTDLIKLIKDVNSSFDEENNSTVYYFDYDADGTCKLVTPDSEMKTEYPITLNHSNKNPYSIVINDSDGSQSSRQSEVENITAVLNSVSSKSKFGNIKFKISYDESKGVHHFLNSVERYSLANNISRDQDKVMIAMNGLSDSDYGEMFTETLSESERGNWSLFREKLINRLGKTANYYKSAYRNFKRMPSETLGVMFSRLTFIYKKAYIESEDLSMTDKRHIICAFIQKQSPRLSQLLMAEESVLTFDSVSTRAEELEQIFCLQNDSAEIMAMIDSKNSRNTRNVDNRHSEMSDLMNRHEKNMSLMIQSFTQALSSFANSNNQRYSDRPYPTRTPNNRSENRSNANRPNGDYSKLRGFCAQTVMQGNCNRNNCRFKHHDIPTEILELKPKN